jgi:hypothetical protein
MDWRSQAVAAAYEMRKRPALINALRAEVRELISAHPDLPDDELTRECLTVLVWEHFAQAADRLPLNQNQIKSA